MKSFINKTVMLLSLTILGLSLGLSACGKKKDRVAPREGGATGDASAKPKAVQKTVEDCIKENKILSFDLLSCVEKCDETKEQVEKDNACVVPESDSNPEEEPKEVEETPKDPPQEGEPAEVKEELTVRAFVIEDLENGVGEGGEDAYFPKKIKKVELKLTKGAEEPVTINFLSVETLSDKSIELNGPNKSYSVHVQCSDEKCAEGIKIIVINNSDGSEMVYEAEVADRHENTGELDLAKVD